MQPAAPARAKNACEPSATVGAGAPLKRKSVHKTATTPTMKKAVASQPCENLFEYTEYTAQAAAAAKVSTKGSGLDETSATTAPPIKIIVATNRKHNAHSRDNSTGQGANEGGTRTRVEGRKQNEHRRPKVIHETQFERLLRTRRQADRDGDRRFVEHEQPARKQNVFQGQTTQWRRTIPNIRKHGSA